MSSGRPVTVHPPSMEPYAPPPQHKTLRVSAWITMVLLGACALGAVWSFYVGVLMWDFTRDAMSGELSTVIGGRLSSLETKAYAAVALQIVPLLGAAAAFITWFYRCRYNAGIFQPDAHRKGQGWSVGAWFVPIGNLWIPKKIANDIWDAAPPGAASRSKAVLHLWWGLWVAQAVFGRLSSGIADTAATLEEIGRSAIVGMAVDTLYLAAAVAAIAFVWRLTTMQEAHMALEPMPGHPQPTPQWGRHTPQNAAGR